MCRTGALLKELVTQLNEAAGNYSIVAFDANRNKLLQVN